MTDPNVKQNVNKVGNSRLSQDSLNYMDSAEGIDRSLYYHAGRPWARLSGLDESTDNMTKIQQFFGARNKHIRERDFIIYPSRTVAM